MLSDMAVKMLSDTVIGIVDRLFPESDRIIIQQIILEECSDKLPLVRTGKQLERIQLAVLKLSNGDADKFLKEVRAARRDWRDVLAAAGFGNDLGAHLRWADETLK